MQPYLCIHEMKCNKQFKPLQSHSPNHILYPCLESRKQETS